MAPWYREYEDIKEDELLDEDEMYWEAHVHARDLEKLRDPEESIEYRFDAVIGYEGMSSEDFLEIEFPTWVKVFGQRFEDAELYFPDYDTDSIF